MSSPGTDFDFLRPSPPQKRQLLYTTSALVVVLAALFSFWREPLFSESYLPHAYCYLQRPALVWTHAVTDSLIGLSYTAISISLGYLLFKGHREIPFRWVFLAFGLFIVACGGTHFVEVVTLWIPVYVLAAGVKIVTAIVSVCTAIVLPFTVPRALTLVREARLSEARKLELETALQERNLAQAALRDSNQRLEQLVVERTSQLAEANAALKSEVAERSQLQASLAKLALIVESSDDAIIGTDLGGTITSWNRGAEEIYGYKAEQVIDRPITVIVPSDRVNENAEMRSRVARGEHIDHFETQRITKAGVLLDVSLTISPTSNSEGAIVGVSTIARDITTAKRAEKALRESEAQYRLLFDHNPLPMWVFDRKSLQFLAVNEAAVRHYGFSRNEFFRMTILDIRPSEDIPAVLQKMAAPIHGLQDAQVWRHRRKDGAIIDVEITAHDLNFHGADAELILSQDITERLRSEKRLRQSQERFAKAFRSSPFGITISDEEERRYVDANPAFLRIMGYGRDEIVGRTWEELSVWVDPQQMTKMLEELNSPQPAEPIEVRFRTRSGEIRLVEVASERISLDDRSCILGIIHDVTEARQLEQQFRQAQKMEAVGRLAGGIAHDFNNMLGVIIGYSEIAKDQLGHGHPVEEHLEEIKKAGNRATVLTRQLLAFSRQQVLEPRILNLNAVVHNVSKMLLRMIGEDISFVLRPTEPLGSVRADLGQIEQILMNLAVNARDAMPQGGKIIVETSNVDLEEGSARQHQPVKPGAYVMLSFTDTGAGMDEATIGRIFEPFFTTKELGTGTGLGLSTVYGIVHQSDGYIRAYSEPGHGTTFKIYLPRVDQSAGSLLGTKAEIAPLPSGTETILVVEDEEAMRNLIVTLLESGGYTVLSAGNATSALAIAQQREYEIDLLLTDVVMPGMTGPGLVAEIKKHRMELKVLYMSGYAGSVMMQPGLLGPDSLLLAKPFSRLALLTRVRAVLES